MAYKVTLLQFRKFSTKTLIWVWNISQITFGEGFHLILPLFFDVPGECKTINKAKTFYFTTYTIEPRRPISQLLAPFNSPPAGVEPLTVCNVDQPQKGFPQTQYCRLHNQYVRSPGQNHSL